MENNTEAIVHGLRRGTPEWVLDDVEVSPDGLFAHFQNGCVRGTSRADALKPLPARLASQLAEPEVFATAYFDTELGTVVWPNGADLAPEFLRWGLHLESGCPCGQEDTTNS